MNLFDNLGQEVLGWTERCHNLFNLLDPANTWKFQNVIVCKLLKFFWPLVVRNRVMPLKYHCATSAPCLSAFKVAIPSTQKSRKHRITYFKGLGFIFESNLRCASDHVFEALHLKDTDVVGQTDREDHLKFGKFLQTAEDNVHSRRTNRRQGII